MRLPTGGLRSVQGHPLYHNRGSLVRDPGVAPGLGSLSIFRGRSALTRQRYAAGDGKSNRVPAPPIRGVTAGQPPRVGVVPTLSHEPDPRSVTLATPKYEPTAFQQVG